MRGTQRDEEVKKKEKMQKHRKAADRQRHKIGIVFLAVCSLVTGCTRAGKEAPSSQIEIETEQSDQETGQTEKLSSEILGREVVTGESFKDSNQIDFVHVDFEDYDVSTALPAVLWDPDNFCNMSEEEKGEDGLDLPLTDWTDDDMFCIVVPSTAFFSLTEKDEETEIAELKNLSDEEFIEKKLEGYSNITALSMVQREETDSGYQTSMKIQIDLSLYNRDFSYEGYWISVYHDGKVLDFSYGEARTEDGESYETAETVLENFKYVG